eukprot:CAMPEP_0194388266 /NCGR_PEP_ID=MMETSP0174-20130528/97479_1 /TAXON_ID=216777 /ORGANISM="Proboscia alata, Strain PI-D3" /LENGTH=31 /DNA_ID= /DNA_START= /DNA_END= /DNA_ORIENTATION=
MMVGDGGGLGVEAKEGGGLYSENWADDMAAM